MKILITEQQFNLLYEQMIIESMFHRGMTYHELIQAIKKLAKNGLLTASIIANIVMAFRLTDVEKNGLVQAAREEMRQIQHVKNDKRMEKDNKTNWIACAFNKSIGGWEKNPKAWKEVANDALATVYNAVPAQCNNDVLHTASMFKLDLNNVLAQRVIAMERTFMKELGLKYGDVVYVEGTGKWDGPWQIQDTMNKRFAGMHKIDILVPRDIRTGKWNNVKISIPTNNEFKTQAKSLLAASK